MTHPGLDAFSALLGAGAAFTAAGQLRYDTNTGLLSGNTDADGDVPWRGNRISGYAFNKERGRGMGSYFQDDIGPGDWIHYVLVINTTPEDAQDPGYMRIYRDGGNAPPISSTPWDDTDSLLEYWPDPTTPHLITPGDGDFPLRIGTRYFRSFVEGAVGKVAIYDYELTPQQIQSHYEAMWA